MINPSSKPGSPRGTGGHRCGREMQAIVGGALRLDLREVVADAAAALAKLDADRLEELALSCRMFHCDCQNSKADGVETYRQAREISKEVALFRGVLEATGANIRVLHQLRDRRGNELEYGRRF